MSALIYSNGQYHALAGNKIVKNGVAITMKNNDQIVADHVAYPLGFSSGGTPETPVIPDAPECAIAHQNGTEPTAGTVRYITPNGAGSMDGSSWGNAANMSMIHVILLSSASGDRVYFSEGDYTTDRTITLPSGVSLFGGFALETPAWATRDAFLHPTRWTASHSGAWINSASNIAGQVIDGFTVVSYEDTSPHAALVTFKNGFISDGTFIWSGTVSNTKIINATFAVATASGCWISGEIVSATTINDSVIIGATSTVQTANGTDFYYGATTVSISANAVNVYGKSNALVSVKLTKATNSAVYYGKETDSHLFLGQSTNCKAYGCTISNINSSIFYVNASSITNCSAVNCKVTTSNVNSSIFYVNASSITNCSAVNCTCTLYNPIFFIWSNLGDSYPVSNCTAINCKAGYIFYKDSATFSSSATNCIVINCTAGNIFGPVSRNMNPINCTAVNCVSYDTVFRDPVKNSLSWNNTGTEFGVSKTTCAGSGYAADHLTLGTDNSIARFTNTGYAPAQGVQDVGVCPNPITDPDGYAAWVESFGDWHPANNSFLLGAGTADSNVTTDMDGTTRPNPPAIGAYEPVPTP